MKLLMVRSDTGDGGWSLHLPGLSDAEIAEGEGLLLSGPATLDESGEWDHPDDADYHAAIAAAERRY